MSHIAASTILGLNSKSLRIAQGWSAARLAKRLGWPLETVIALEAGRFDASLDELDSLAHCLSASLHQLMLAPEAQASFSDTRRSA